MKAATLRISPRTGILRSVLARAIRYVLVRPLLKRSLMRALSSTPGLLMAVKRLGVRFGMASLMGPGHLAINGRASSLALQGRMTARAARIYEDLRCAMVARDR
ncbi:hypothetical protein DGM85_04270 [Xanthomonas phaseoli pv. phaseoli]|uniref:Uncharacterized protein n=1 Tax=Xanthomonas campestris pv. phaseoli TaxID=317013 RepID=A0AB38E5A0_XANCH|nr:hypothetical protein DGM93_18270 [Xanthomonas phaseoli pv. phaseoli]QWN27858.1 hypothetical protein DGM85_04270 [Xanthomonas phaseoli pv. phaseoli]QWN34303.1 hypothetical protein DGM81_18030 [Xanthomonas phaseoli pv. phaseoli]SON87964.1 conserved hypothetical protein [Xanthomonas phaseoli pv. phaseoli]SON90665.1 conserved hypothetical protein [Xanthomonas phaseoli pv. phaseoli]